MSVIIYRIVGEAFIYTSIVLFVIVILVQIPWTFYFIARMLQEKKAVSSLKSRKVQSDTTGQLILKHKNQLTLQKFFFTATLFELLMTLLIVVDYALDGNRDLISFNCSEYYYVPYLFVKYFLEFIDIVFLESTLEMLNLTTLFVKDVYLRNSTHGGIKKKIKRFLMRILLVLGLGVSGIGLGIAYILCEVFIIIQLVQYYRYSKQLYRSLGMHYEDTKYEFGIKSIEARNAWKQKKHYRYFTIWFFTIANIMVLGILGFTICLPILILGEECIPQVLQARYNLTFTNSTIFKYIEYTILPISSSFPTIASILFIPIYTGFSMYFICSKLLFGRVTRYRYNVGCHEGEDDLKQAFV